MCFEVPYVSIGRKVGRVSLLQSLHLKVLLLSAIFVVNHDVLLIEFLKHDKASHLFKEKRGRLDVFLFFPCRDDHCKENVAQNKTLKNNIKHLKKTSTNDSPTTMMIKMTTMEPAIIE